MVKKVNWSSKQKNLHFHKVQGSTLISAVIILSLILVVISFYQKNLALLGDENRLLIEFFKNRF